MKTLIIKAHPSSAGFAHKIADTYKDTLENKGLAVEVIDLYKDEQYQQPFLSFEDSKGEWSGQEVRVSIQERITWADELVFVYPTWWMNMPAIMKNFLDNNFTNNFAFSFQDGKMQGLLKGKSVRIFATADGPSFAYLIMKPMLNMIFSKGVFGFCGMKLKSFDVFSNMVGQQNDATRNKMLELVKKRA